MKPFCGSFSLASWQGLVGAHRRYLYGITEEKMTRGGRMSCMDVRKVMYYQCREYRDCKTEYNDAQKCLGWTKCASLRKFRSKCHGSSCSDCSELWTCLTHDSSIVFSEVIASVCDQIRDDRESPPEDTLGRHSRSAQPGPMTGCRSRMGWYLRNIRRTIGHQATPWNSTLRGQLSVYQCVDKLRNRVNVRRHETVGVD